MGRLGPGQEAATFKPGLIHDSRIRVMEPPRPMRGNHQREREKEKERERERDIKRYTSQGYSRSVSGVRAKTKRNWNGT